MLHTAGISKFTDQIAIIGIGCSFPGGIESPDALWQFLSRGGDAVVEVPADRWNVDAVYDPTPGTPGKTVCRRAGLLREVASFDAGFFGISPREAAPMDPQQRLLLQVAWRALEDAGIPAESLAGSSTGVYIGVSHSDYHGIQQFGRRQIDVHAATGGALSIVANRLSHRLDLRGPSLAIDTACSSSLVALDAACTALLTGECDATMVGGVNVMLTPDVTITFSRAAMLSPDGRCKAFDARANGYVRGEGAGIVILKLLSRALLDGDRIHAVIRGTAVNQDGRTSTITVPSRDAQIAMLRQACAKANIHPSQIGYVEAHGTGTAVGDPITRGRGDAWMPRVPRGNAPPSARPGDYVALPVHRRVLAEAVPRAASAHDDAAQNMAICGGLALVATMYYDAARFPFTTTLEQNWRVIRAELDAL